MKKQVKSQIKTISSVYFEMLEFFAFEEFILPQWRDVILNIMSEEEIILLLNTEYESYC